MVKKEKKKKAAKIFFNQIILAIIGLVILILISIPLAKNISRRYKINSEVKDLENEISGLENKNANLKGLIAYLGSDQFIEEQARLNLGLKKKGEDVIVVNTGDGGRTDALFSSSTINSVFNIPGLKNIQPEKKANNAQKWCTYFFR